MPVIHLTTFINAPAKRVFDLSRSITLHATSMKHTNETAIAGTTTGLIKLNETVTWKARHLFKTRFLQTKITSMFPYTSFIDEQVNGDFKMMKHEHYFKEQKGETLMEDIFMFETPFGIAGSFLNILFLKKYMSKLLSKRNEIIKEYAESDKWKAVL